MSPLRRTVFCLAGAVALWSLSLLAQPAPGVAPAFGKSPVELFRQLLKMSPEECKKAIASRPPEIQRRILEKLDEYRILPGDLAEMRLRETELRWYLRPLMDVPRTNRAALLARIPEDERKIVEDRLQHWDIVPPDLQQQWKNDDTVANYFAQATPEELKFMLTLIPPGRRKTLQEGLYHWNQMSEDQRQKALAGFNSFFKLTPEEKSNALDTVSDEERQQMEKTLEAYGKLTPAQRAQCIKSFEKFAAMGVSERQQFLKNAERWSAMTPDEREKWRQLVNVAPIMPPMDSPTPSPTQPDRSRLNSPTMATN